MLSNEPLYLTRRICKIGVALFTLVDYIGNKEQPVLVHFVCFYDKISLVSFIEDIRDQDQIAPLGAVWSGLTRDKLVRWPILHTLFTHTRFI